MSARGPSLLTVQEAAGALGVSCRTILIAISDGKLRAAKPGKRYLIKESWLEDYLDAEAGIFEGNNDE